MPELAPLPDEHLPKPAKTPLAVQVEAGVHVGDDYPRPVVDFEQRAAETREQFAALDERATEALSDERVRRRGSFSNRGGRSESTETTDRPADGQSSLADF